MRDEIKKLFTVKEEPKWFITSVTLDTDVVACLDEIKNEFNLNRSDVVNTILRYHLIGDVSPNAPLRQRKYKGLYGPRMSKKLRDERLGRILNDADNGLTHREIAEKENLSIEYVRQLIRDRGPRPSQKKQGL